MPKMFGNEKKYLEECIETNFVSTAGPFVPLFEKHIAKWSGVDDALAVNTGTSALHLSYIAAGVKPGSLVITPNLSFIATTNAIAYCHAEPWFVDIEEETWCLSPDKLEIALSENTKLVDGNRIHIPTGREVTAIVVVFTLGCPGKMDELKIIANKYNLPLIADAAAAIGAKYKGRAIGELADFTTYSFNGNKIITSGGGGGIVARSKDKLKYIRHISTTARVGRDYIHDEVGFNYRMTNLEAAVGCAQFEHLDFCLRRKQEIRSYYNKALSEISCFTFFPSPSFAVSTNWFSGFVVALEHADKVDVLMSRLVERKIEVRSFWRPLSTQKPFINSPKENCDYSNNLWSRIVCLPCSTSISDEELVYVVDQVKMIVKEIIG